MASGEDTPFVEGLNSGQSEASLEHLHISPCNMCPRMCGAMRADGKRGQCGAGAYLEVARAALHYWEEPPLSGVAGSGAVFFVHCPLGCVYCQNAPIAAGQFGQQLSTEALAATCLDLQKQGALNVNFVTPAHYTTQIIEAVQQARLLGLVLPVVWNTSGYERVEVVRALRTVVDVYLTDFKYASTMLAQDYSHAPDYVEVALAALDEMVCTHGQLTYDQVDGQPRLTHGIIVRHLLLPGALEHSKQVLRLLFERYENSVLYSIMNQYTPLLATRAQAGDVLAARVLQRFPNLGNSVPAEEYEELLDFADELGLQDYFWQEGPANTESFIPAWDGTGLVRSTSSFRG